MLDFDNSLDASLKNQDVSFWVLKLYYKDESSSEFTGVSDQHRVNGSDVYHGIVSSWGSLTQSLDFYKFQVTQANMSVTLINTEESIRNIADTGRVRFSDLSSEVNYAHRKWELFQCTKGTATFDDSDNMIGSGVIAGDHNYDTEKITLTLLDNSSRLHKKVPFHSVDVATYPRAPKTNIGSPVPMSYGDFDNALSDSPDEGSYGDFYYHFRKGHFPAVVIDEEDENGFRKSLPDSDQPYGSSHNLTVLNSLNADAVYLGAEGEYLQCNKLNAKVAVGSLGNSYGPTEDGHNVLYVSGHSYFAYLNLRSITSEDVITTGHFSNVCDRSIDSDGEFDTTAEFGATFPTERFCYFRFPEMKEVGRMISDSNMHVLVYKTNIYETGGSEEGMMEVQSPGSDGGLGGGTEGTGFFKRAISGNDFDDDEQQTLSFQDHILTISHRKIDSGTSGHTVSQLGVQIEVIPKVMVGKPIVKQEVIYTGERNDPGGYKIVNTEVVSGQTGESFQYLYYSGKGREFGSWVDQDSRNNGYNSGGLIENPVYIIENILRSELGLSSSAIDYDSFDEAGNTTDGHIANAFDISTIKIKFAFSHYKFMDSRELIQRIAAQCFSYVFIGGDGKFKIKTLRRGAGYTSADKVIDYQEIVLNGVSKTTTSQIKNDVTVKYAYDYLNETFTKEATDVQGFVSELTDPNHTGKLSYDGFGILDDDTANALAEGYRILFQGQKPVLEIKCLRPHYNNLELGDVVSFVNWDSKIKIYGTAMAADDYYLITDISKLPFGCNITAVQVG